MKKIYILFFAFVFSTSAFSQVNSIQLSQSANVLTVAGTRTQLWADPTLNTVIFIHRGSDDLFYDISQDGGVTWNINRGPLYSSTTQRPRYPQAVIADPEGYGDVDSAFVSFLAPL